MTEIELILFAIALIVLLIGLYFIFYNNNGYEEIGGILSVLSVAAILILLCVYDDATTETVSENMIIKIEDMKTTHTGYYINKIWMADTDYYVYFENDGETERVEVSSSVYNDYSVGDTIMIQKKIVYNIDRETGERLSVSSISYNCQ